jgi:copper chaperone
MTNRTITLEITGMHCASCGILVDDCMEDVDGVVSSQTELKSGRCVTVVADSVTDSAVLAAVAEAGYTATFLESLATS